jgi:cobalt-zinc-cadmium efflux system membrane fusion protein
VISPLTDGVITEVLKDVGDLVEEGEIVASIQSTEFAEARSALQKAEAESELALQTVKREEDLYTRQISARQDLEQARAAATVAASEVTVSLQRLQSLGFDRAEAKGKGNSDASLPVRAPFSGTIIERLAARGTGASPGIPLFRIADLSTMWMIVSVPESLLTSVLPGRSVSTRFDTYPGMAFEGKVEWVSPSVDPQTRMVQARVELANSLGLLKDGLFGHANLQGGGEGTAMSVPASAIQDVDGTTVVFRKLEDDLFEARRVEIGDRNGDQALVLAGLAPDEEIVTEGSYVVKSELLKARLGAGCTDE